MHIQNPLDGEGWDPFFIGDESLKPSENFWKSMRKHPNCKIFTILRWQDLGILGLAEEDFPACSRVTYFLDGCTTNVMLGQEM